jgi:hypothetical protein
MVVMVVMVGQLDTCDLAKMNIMPRWRWSNIVYTPPWYAEALIISWLSGSLTCLVSLDMVGIINDKVTPYTIHVSPYVSWLTTAFCVLCMIPDFELTNLDTCQLQSHRICFCRRVYTTGAKMRRRMSTQPLSSFNSRAIRGIALKQGWTTPSFQLTASEVLAAPCWH